MKPQSYNDKLPFGFFWLVSYMNKQTSKYNSVAAVNMETCYGDNLSLFALLTVQTANAVCV